MHLHDISMLMIGSDPFIMCLLSTCLILDSRLSFVDTKINKTRPQPRAPQISVEETDMSADNF